MHLPQHKRPGGVGVKVGGGAEARLRGRLGRARGLQAAEEFEAAQQRARARAAERARARPQRPRGLRGGQVLPVAARQQALAHLRYLRMGTRWLTSFRAACKASS